MKASRLRLHVVYGHQFCSVSVFMSCTNCECSLHACVVGRLCTHPASVCACVRLFALVIQAVSHTHRSKLRVGEGHCGADGGDGEASGDGGWAGGNQKERDDDKKLKAVRKWDVGWHSRAGVFTINKYISPSQGGSRFFHPFEAKAAEAQIDISL